MNVQFQSTVSQGMCVIALIVIADRKYLVVQHIDYMFASFILLYCNRFAQLLSSFELNKADLSNFFKMLGEN